MVPAGLAVGNAILWGLRPGKYVAQANRFAGKAFTKYIQPSIDRWLGRRPPLIEISKQSEDNDKCIFNIEKVEIVNHSLIQSQIEHEMKQDAVIDIKALDEQRLKEIKSTGARSEGPSKGTTPVRGPFYDIKLIITKQDGREISLGEIDFADWQNRKDFTFEITKQGKNSEPTILDKTKDASEYNSVLETLRILPKTLANGAHSPIDNTEVITTKSGGIGLIDWYKRVIRGETVIQYLAPDEEHPFLQKDSFIDGIAKLAAEDITKDPNSKIIDNYFATTELSLENQLNAAKKAEKELALEVKTRESARRRQILISLAVVIGTVLAVAGTIVLAAFSPPLLALAIGTAISSFLGFAKSLLFGSLYTLGFGAIFTGLAVNYNDYKKEITALAKNELTETQALVKSAKEELSELKEEKEGAKNTLKVIAELKNAHSLNPEKTTLDLSHRDPNMPNIGAMGAKILRSFLCNPKIAADKDIRFCTTIKLSNNNLGREELLELARALGESGTYEQFQIQNIDLTGNPIKSDLTFRGFIDIQEALTKNFTVTTFSCDDFPDTGYTGNKTKVDFARIRGTIEKETLINLYLQKGLTPEVTARLERLGNLTSEDLQAAATKKITENFTVINIPHTSPTVISSKIEKIIKQNKLFTQLNGSITTPEKRRKIYIDAFIEDADRCVKFSTQTDGLIATFKPQIKEAIAKNVFELLRVDAAEERKKLIYTVFAPITKGSDIEKNIDLLTKILDNLQTLGVKRVDDSIVSFLAAAFEDLGTKTIQDLTTKLKDLQEKLFQSNIDLSLKRDMCKALGLALDSSLASIESPKFITNYLKQQIANAPKDPTLNLSTFEEFVKTCCSPIVSDSELIETLNQIDVDKLLELVQVDVYPSKAAATVCANLRNPDLSSTRRQAILARCFNNETPKDSDKSQLLASLLGDKAVADLFFDRSKVSQARADFREKFLHYSFYISGFWGIRRTYNSTELKNKLEELRKAAVASGEYAEAELLDKSAQTLLQTKLEKDFSCLRSPSYAPDDSEALQKALKNSTTLRSFKYSKGMPDQAQKNIESTILRNKLHDAIINHKNFTYFIKEYFAITSAKERQNCLQAFKVMATSNTAALLELVKNDTSQGKPPVLVTLEEGQRIEILAAVLGEDNPEARAIAIVTSKLIGLKDKLITAELIGGIFNRSTNIGRNFNQYIAELKTLRDTQPSIAENIEAIIQAGLQTYLIKKFDCLTGKADTKLPPFSFDLLKDELKDNPDLTDFKGFNFESSDTKTKVQNYVTNICWRNLLEKAVEKGNLINFMKTYNAITPAENCQAVLKLINEEKKLPFLQMLMNDLGSNTSFGGTINSMKCEELYKLDSAQRIALLEYCFTLNDSQENAHKKAVAIDHLLNIPSILDRSDQPGKDIRYEIYWAIAPYARTGGKPSYDLKHLQTKLPAIIDQISETDESLKVVRNAISKAISATNALEQPPTVTLVAQETVSNEVTLGETSEVTHKKRG